MTNNAMRTVPRTWFTKSLELSGPVVVRGDVGVVTLVMTAVVLDDVDFVVDGADVLEVAVFVVVEAVVVVGKCDVEVWDVVS